MKSDDHVNYKKLIKVRKERLKCKTDVFFTDNLNIKNLILKVIFKEYVTVENQKNFFVKARMPANPLFGVEILNSDLFFLDFSVQYNSNFKTDNKLYIFSEDDYQISNLGNNDFKNMLKDYALLENINIINAFSKENILKFHNLMQEYNFKEKNILNMNIKTMDERNFSNNIFYSKYKPKTYIESKSLNYANNFFMKNYQYTPGCIKKDQEKIDGILYDVVFKEIKNQKLQEFDVVFSNSLNGKLFLKNDTDVENLNLKNVPVSTLKKEYNEEFRYFYNTEELLLDLYKYDDLDIDISKQSLYNLFYKNKIITNPYTDNKKITKNFNIKNIIKAVKKMDKFNNSGAEALIKFSENRHLLSDIMNTEVGIIPFFDDLNFSPKELAVADKKVFFRICDRFLNCIINPYIIKYLYKSENKKYELFISANEEIYDLNLKIRDIYKYKENEISLDRLLNILGAYQINYKWKFLEIIKKYIEHNKGKIIFKENSGIENSLLSIEDLGDMNIQIEQLKNNNIDFKKYISCLQNILLKNK